MMSRDVWHLEEVFSIQPLIDLNNIGNILAQDSSRIQQWKYIMSRQMRRRQLTDAVIHLHPWTDYPDDHFEKLLSCASRLIVWQVGSSAHQWQIDEKIEVVRYVPRDPQQQERFMIITSSSYTKALVSWRQAADKDIFAVLMTTPASIQSVSDTLTQYLHDVYS